MFEFILVEGNEKYNRILIRDPGSLGLDTFYFSVIFPICIHEDLPFI